MTRNVLKVFLLTAVLTICGCPDSSSGSSNNNLLFLLGSQRSQKYSSRFFGEWIRMDTGELWYISGNSISVNGIEFNENVSLVKSSEQIITVREPGRTDYYLFASRVPNSSFNAKVVLIDDEGELYSVSRSSQGKTGQLPPIKIFNPKQPDEPPVVKQPNPGTGEITVDGMIPGDPVEIIPDDSGWNDVRVGVTPEDGLDVGIIPLAKGINLKTTIRMANSNDNIRMLFADGTAQNYIIEVKNIGTINSTGASYELIMNDAENGINFNRDFILHSGNDRGLLDTIRPGEKKDIPISLGSKPIIEGRRVKKIGIRITEYDTQAQRTKIWADTVSVNYYKTRIPFRFKSQKPVQGVIKAPGGGTYYFKTEGTENNYSYSINVPWSNEDYIIVFLGASVNTNSETPYSLAIDDLAPSDWISIVGNQHLNEPVNNSENSAPVLDMETNKTFMGYLHDGDVDYYRVNLGDEVPESKSNIRFSGFGDEAVNLAKNTENDIILGETITITVNGDFDSYYRWYWNGNFQTNTNVNYFSINTDINFPVGIHTVSVIVTRNGIPYSKEVTFRVKLKE